MNKEVKNKIIVFILVSLILFTVSGVIISSAYSVFYTDDFSHSLGVGRQYQNFFDRLKSSISYSISLYNGWQGTYFSMFMQSFLSPLNGADPSLQLQIVMVANSALFFFSFAILIISVLEKSNINSKIIKLTILFLLLFQITGYQYYPEIWYWFSGAISYSLPLSICFIGLTAVNHISIKNPILWFIIAVISGFFSMGGSLAVTGFGCYFLVVLICLSYTSTKQINRLEIITLVIWLIFALINLLAPGNFLRHSYESNDNDIHLLEGLFDSISLVEQRYQLLYKSTNFSCLAFCFILIGTKICSNDIKKLPFAIILNLLLPVAVSLPVVMGYGMIYLPNRCAFVLDVSIYITSAFVFLWIGTFIKQKIKLEHLIYVIAMCSFVCFMLDGYGLSDVKFITISKKLRIGAYAEHYADCMDFYDSLKTYELNSDVEIEHSDIPYGLDPLPTFYLSEDPNNMHNTRIANYYGLKSIKVINNSD